MDFVDYLRAKGIEVEVEAVKPGSVTESLTLMFKRKPDGKVVVGPVAIEHDSKEEYEKATTETKLANLREQGYDVIRIVDPSENIIGGITFGQK